ncbi:Protein of unknown function DUF2620 [Clostridium cavendishii DSM 21758]|uniref:DUF2620 domain-containing protein n=1 Tax=Clostridium cavendishii DSM 21758 TaxID=1121302 RepID=A0A1M6GSF3_9CLOT|nr:DUF2620 family protein [Clostridium cavendishii]SHJ12861.1 Protein of unknown function DUF2620 [Clostridium cavendishii DSM 21758]
MIKIAVGGLNKNEMERAIKAAGGDKVQVIVTNDMAGAKMLKSGEADYYFGACNSGGGAAISILIGMIGFSKCVTIAKNGQQPKKEEIEKHVKAGKIVFGMAIEAIDIGAPMLVDILLNNK